MTALNKQAIDFSQPLETESGEPVKYICHDLIEYKCARVCVDIATGIVYSSPYVGLKIRNKEANPRSKLREQIESAADAYWQFDNGWISDMKCGDLSHEYLLFAKEPKNVLALLDELEAAEKRIAELEAREVTLPPLNDDLIAILGRPNFTCSHLAELMRKSGDEIRRKSEHEQAAVIHWFLGIYLEHGDKWEGVAKADIQSRVAAAGIGVEGE